MSVPFENFETRAADGIRSHAYDGAGHRQFDSEWSGCTNPATDCVTNTAAGTSMSDFDAIGRARLVTHADGSTSNAGGLS